MGMEMGIAAKPLFLSLESLIPKFPTAFSTPNSKLFELKSSSVDHPANTIQDESVQPSVQSWYVIILFIPFLRSFLLIR